MQGQVANGGNERLCGDGQWSCAFIFDHRGVTGCRLLRAMEEVASAMATKIFLFERWPLTSSTNDMIMDAASWMRWRAAPMAISFEAKCS